MNPCQQASNGRSTTAREFTAVPACIAIYMQKAFGAGEKRVARLVRQSQLRCVCGYKLPCCRAGMPSTTAPHRTEYCSGNSRWSYPIRYGSRTSLTSAPVSSRKVVTSSSGLTPTIWPFLAFLPRLMEFHAESANNPGALNSALSEGF